MPSTSDDAEVMITIAELKRSCTLLLEHVESLGVAKVALAHDYYWFIEKNEVYDPERTPTALSIGQLSDDIDELRKALKGDAPPVALLLVPLASILRKVGEDTNG